MLTLNIKYWIHHEHGEFPSREDNFTIEIEDWKELCENIESDYGGYLDIISIEVI